ncbi:MAG: lasso peptide biosynthesis B2 protein [Acidobacteriota bacterium]|nr:lasso peptide biosynthesis B2 protein [Acidobacteriota bacterium]
MRVSPAERGLFLRGIVAMALVRMALLIFPLQRIVNALNRIDRHRPPARNLSIDTRQAALRISQAAALCPVPTTCLSRTIAAHFLMLRLGFTSIPRIGVSKAEGRFAAHAWLECQDGIVIGSKSPDGRTYNPVPSLERFFA